jgi:FtsH-binding integral membrane protein
MVIFSLLIHVIFAKNEITFQSVALYIFGAVYLMTLLFVIFVEISNITLYVTAILSILWGFYIVWENETVVGAKNEWSREDYFSGAIAVYMYIFILILKLVELIK